jgi:hypothetical protein
MLSFHKGPDDGSKPLMSGGVKEAVFIALARETFKRSRRQCSSFSSFSPIRQKIPFFREYRQTGEFCGYL